MPSAPSTAESEDPRRARWRRRLKGFLVFVGLVLTLTTVPGVFIIDDVSYLMTVVTVRAGGFEVPGTEDLPPSQGLFWFDTAKESRRMRRAPVYSVTPPLYSFLALPFSLLGWRGLVALNTLAFLATALLVLVLTRELTEDWRVPLLATFAFTVGSYMLEYAQGLWPQMLSMFLCTLGYALARRACRDQGHGMAALGGLVAGLSIGVRYPNLVYAGGVGLGLLLCRRGRRVAPAFAAGVLPALLVMAAINQVRLGVPNPVTKGGRYLSADAGELIPTPAHARPGPEVRPAGLHLDREELADFTRSMLTFVVDFRFHPGLSEAEQARQTFWTWHPSTRIFTMAGGEVTKKAWLQSVPWGYLGLLVLLLAWRRGGGAGRLGEEVRALGAVVFPWLIVFAHFGTDRYDGFCYNQRYLLDVVPLLAVALGVGADGSLQMDRRTVFRGWLEGVVLSAHLLLGRTLVLRQVLTLSLPHVLGAALLGARAAGRRDLFTRALAASIVFAFCVHTFDDTFDAWTIRYYHSAYHESLARTLPSPSALVLHWGATDDAGPLPLTHDVVILDTWPDRGETAPAVIAALRDRGRPIYVLRTGMPEDVFARVRGDRRVEPVPLAPSRAPLESVVRGLLGDAIHQELVGPPLEIVRLLD